ncbi:hypothetical protein Q8A73_011181 [Channa argus]|nr:hypothetical protein Q8A73_011181 [Channa argus]
MVKLTLIHKQFPLVLRQQGHVIPPLAPLKAESSSAFNRCSVDAAVDPASRYGQDRKIRGFRRGEPLVKPARSGGRRHGFSEGCGGKVSMLDSLTSQD